MTVRVWKTMALTTALLVWAATSQAQSTAGAPAAGQGGQGALPQVRPAAISGRVTVDPAAVALHPAESPIMSTARQVPPPANLDEPLLAPESEQVKRASSGVRRVSRDASGQRQETSPPEAAPTRPHVNRTRGVKKSNETQPRPHERKPKGKPHHGGQKASSVEPQDKDERRHGGKRGGVAPAKLTPHTAEGRRVPHPNRPVAQGKPVKAAQPQARKPAAMKRARHARAAAAAPSAPVAKKPVRHQHPSA